MGTVALVSESHHLKRLSTLALRKKRKENPKHVFCFMALFVKMFTEQIQAERATERKRTGQRILVKRGISREEREIQAAPNITSNGFPKCLLIYAFIKRGFYFCANGIHHKVLHQAVSVPCL